MSKISRPPEFWETSSWISCHFSTSFKCFSTVKMLRWPFGWCRWFRQQVLHLQWIKFWCWISKARAWLWTIFGAAQAFLLGVPFWWWQLTSFFTDYCHSTLTWWCPASTGLNRNLSSASCRASGARRKNRRCHYWTESQPWIPLTIMNQTSNQCQGRWEDGKRLRS